MKETAVIQIENPSICDDSALPVIQSLAPTTWRILFPLTFTMATVQFVWTIEMGYGTPYLTDLGLNKSMLTSAWLAGPLSGLIMQPLVGSWSDACRSRFGRRRPFIVAGTVGIVCSLMLVAYSRAIGLMIQDDVIIDGLPWNIAAVVVALLGFCSLDFAINAVSASMRSLIVDILPMRYQHRGSTWASMMIGVGNIAGYLTGWLDFSSVCSQMTALILVAIILQILGTCVTCWFAREEPLPEREFEETQPKSLAGYFKPVLTLFSSIFFLPRDIQLICCVQFFAWFGWFPFTFFTTEWIKELQLEGNSEQSVGFAVRIGSLSLLMYSFVSLFSAIVIPRITMRFGLSLYRVWASSHLLFAGLMFSSYWVTTAHQGMAIVMCVGVCWAVTMWIPFTLLGESIHHIILADTEEIDDCANNSERDITRASSSTDPTPNLTRRRTKSIHSRLDINLDAPEDSGELTTGVLLSIHNAYIVMPQLLASLAGAFIFQRSGDGSHSIALLWQVGGAMALIACLISLYMGSHGNNSRQYSSLNASE